MSKPRVFGYKDDKRFWSDKPKQEVSCRSASDLVVESFDSADVDLASFSRSVLTIDGKVFNVADSIAVAGIAGINASKAGERMRDLAISGGSAKDVFTRLLVNMEVNRDLSGVILAEHGLCYESKQAHNRKRHWSKPQTQNKRKQLTKAQKRKRRGK